MASSFERPGQTGPPSGVDRAVAAIIYALNRAEYEVELVTFGNPDLNAIRRLYGFDFKVAKVHEKTSLQAEDIAETTNLNGVVNVSFEDKDIAYLLGFVSFAR